MHEPPSTQPDLPQPGPRGRQGRPSGLPSKPSSPGIGQPGTADRSRPRSRSTERRRRPRTGGTGASRDRGRPGPRRVRTPSRTPGPRRAAAGTAGAQQPQLTRPSPLRPRPAKRHGSGFELPTRCREPSGLLPTRRRIIEEGPHPQTSSEPSPSGASLVVLAGRATRVPVLPSIGRASVGDSNSLVHEGYRRDPLLTVRRGDLLV